MAALLLGCLSRKAIRRSSIAFPPVRDKVGQCGFEQLAGGCGVAPVMCLAAFVDPVDRVSTTKEATEAAITLVDQRVAPSSTLDHCIEVPRSSLARIVKR